jgi:hypothetical protein
LRVKADLIAEVGIDAQERLYIRPATVTFPQIYREAREVHWDAAARRLHSPKPREWNHARWFRQIVAAADAYGQPLCLTPATVWVNIPDELKTEFERITPSAVGTHEV